MGRRSVLLAVGLWLAVVVVVSGATWAVIDAAGRDVTTRPAADPAATGGALRTVTPETSAPRATPTARPRPSRPSRPTRTPSRTRTTPAVPVPSAVATEQPDVTTPASPVTTAPAPRPSTRPATKSTPPAPAPRPQERTWSGRAGSVAARCTGSTIGLASAWPGDGWRMQVDERGPSRVKVEFHLARSDREAESESETADSVEVRAECVGGVPRFRVDS